MMTRAHHIRERQQRRHQRIVLADRQSDERAVCLRDAHRLSLRSIGITPIAEKSAVKARCLQSFVTEDAGAVGVGERHDNQIASLHGADTGTDRFDDADSFVTHATASLAVFHRLIWPEIAAADARIGDGHERIGRLDQASVGDGLDTDIACAIHAWSFS
jgi:hypothetical protein